MLKYCLSSPDIGEMCNAVCDLNIGDSTQVFFRDKQERDNFVENFRSTCFTPETEGDFRHEVYRLFTPNYVITRIR